MIARLAPWLALAMLGGAAGAKAQDDAGAAALGRPSVAPDASASEASHAALGAHHDTSPRPDFALDVDAAATLPLVVGGTVALEVPGHVVFRVGAGIVPSAFVDAINEVGVGWGAYDAHSAQVASALLDDATFLEFGLALRPAGTPGIELAASYALLWSHRTLPMPLFGAPPSDAGLDLTIDAIHGELAWQNEPVDHVYFRIAIGWAHCFAHGVTIAGEGDAATQATFHVLADALADAIGRYAFGPTLAASLGFRI